MIFTLLACIGHCFHVSSLPCNVSLAQSCPASLYYVPNSPKTLAAAASLFHVDSNLVRQTVNGYLVNVNCSCPAGHTAFTWHMDYTVQPGDTWEQISSSFGSFVVKKTDKMLISLQNVTLDLLCGCSKDNKEIVTYRVKHGDTLYTICSRFSADLNQTVQLNGIDNSGLIHDGDVIFIPEPGRRDDCPFFVTLRFLDSLFIMKIFLQPLIISWMFFHGRFSIGGLENLLMNENKGWLQVSFLFKTPITKSFVWNDSPLSHRAEDFFHVH